MLYELRIEELHVVRNTSETGFVEFGSEELVQVGKLSQTVTIEASKV